MMTMIVTILIMRVKILKPQITALLNNLFPCDYINDYLGI